MVPPWPETEPAAPARVTVLLVTPGGRRGPPQFLPCPAARFRPEPCSGRRLELISGELRHPRSLLLAPNDADELQLLVRDLRRLNGRRRAFPEPSAMFGLAGG